VTQIRLHAVAAHRVQAFLHGVAVGGLDADDQHVDQPFAGHRFGEPRIVCITVPNTTSSIGPAYV
jgi:hypothetical protein